MVDFWNARKADGTLATWDVDQSGGFSAFLGQNPDWTLIGRVDTAIQRTPFIAETGETISHYVNTIFATGSADIQTPFVWEQHERLDEVATAVPEKQTEPITAVTPGGEWLNYNPADGLIKKVDPDVYSTEQVDPFPGPTGPLGLIPGVDSTVEMIGLMKEMMPMMMMMGMLQMFPKAR